jgi:hypothetical protein
MNRTALLGLAALFVASSAVADTRFVGQSRATPQLKRDVLTAIASYTKFRHSCDAIATIETTSMGETFEPKTPIYRVNNPGHLYERWVADLCGSKRAFLVALWPSPKGGADYKVVEVPPGTEP